MGATMLLGCLYHKSSIMLRKTRMWTKGRLIVIKTLRKSITSHARGIDPLNIRGWRNDIKDKRLSVTF